MEASQLILPAIVLGIAVVMGILGLSNRVIAKLGLRNFLRHRGHAAISIVGLLVGTSIICASMVVGDSIEYFIVEDTYNELELVDMEIYAERSKPFPAEVYDILVANSDIGMLTDGISPLFVGSITLRNTDTGLFEPSVSVIGFDHGMDKDFGYFTDENGSSFDGSGLSPNGTIINRELARELDANVGDILLATYTLGNGFSGYGDVRIKTLVVEGVAEEMGKARYSPKVMLGSSSYNAFVIMETAQDMFQAPGMYTHIKISNNGGVIEGAELSGEVSDLVKPVLSVLTFQANDMQMAMMPNQTMFMLNNSNILGGSLTITVNGTQIPASGYGVNVASGMVTLANSLQPGDILTANYEHTYNLKISPRKQNGLDSAKMFNDIVSTFLTIFGSFAIIAGVILIINIFTMLAEERKSELGMARAVGMKRKHLMQSFLFEGLAYGGIASLMGVLVGVGVGYILIYLVNEFVTFLNIQIPFYFKLFSLVEAFSLGFVITFITIMLTSWKISKLNIMQAIRGIEEPPRKRSGILMIPMGVMLLAASALLYFMYPDEALAILLGPSGMLTGTIMLLWRWIGNRASIIAASLGVFLYTFYAIKTSLGDIGSDQIDVIFILSGAIIVLSMVLLVMYNSRPIILAVVNTIGRVRKFRPTVMTAVSYPLTKKFRTGMSVAMFALVIYMIVMLSVFSGMFVIDVEKETLTQGGGFHIQAESQIPVLDIHNVSDPFYGTTITSAALESNISRVAQLSRSYAIEANITDRQTERPSGFFGFAMDFNMGTVIYGIDRGFYENSTFDFSKTMEGYDDADDIWNAVMSPGSDKIIVNTFANMLLGAEPGNHIVFTTLTGNRTREFQVIAVMDQNMLTGIFMSRTNAIMEFGGMGAVNSVFLLELDSSMDAVSTGKALERDFAALGMNSVIIRDQVEMAMETTNSLFVLFELYLDMGLVVGVAGLGIISIRSVVERTPEIGILRSLGFKRKNVRNAFLLEILFVATLGVAIGIFTGVLVSQEIFNIIVKDFAHNIEYTIPWAKIAYVTAIAYIATILCTIVPARKASKISPAEALRYVG